MLQKKICLLGAFAVGKTSLIMRYVDSIFDEKYLTTVGVKVDKKQLQVDEQNVTLMIWDLAGQDEVTRLRTSYLRGVSGYIIVVDGTRPFSLDAALDLHKTAREYVGDAPFVIAINKADLIGTKQWAINESQTALLKEQGVEVLFTSALNNQGVEVLFETLTHNMLKASAAPITNTLNTL